MDKNKKTHRYIKLQRSFLPLFFIKGLDGRTKNILLKALGCHGLSGIIQGETTHKDRTKKHLQQLKKATFGTGDPIFKSIFYRQGKIHFTLSKAIEKARGKSRQYAIVSISEFCKIRSKNVKALYLRMLFATQKFTLRISPPELTNFFGYRKLKSIKKDIIKPFVRLIQAHTTLRIINYSFKKGLLNVVFKLAYDGFCYIDKIRRHAFKILTKRYNQEAYIANQAISHLSIQALDKLDRRLIKKKAEKRLDDIKSYAFVSIQNELNKTLLRS